MAGDVADPTTPAAAPSRVTRLIAVLLVVVLTSVAGFASPVAAAAGVGSAPPQRSVDRSVTQVDPPEPPEPSEPPASTTTTVDVPRTTVPALEERVTESQAATTRLNRAVVGLILLAVVIAGVTVYFWIRTRPNRTGRSHRRRGATIVTTDGTEQPVLEQSVGDFFSSQADGG